MKYGIGIDIGSTCAKTIVMGEDGSILRRSLQPTGWSSVDTAEGIRDAVGGGALTEAGLREIRVLRLGGLPESWEELALLPALERIELPQQALLDGGELPEGDYVIELSGGAS